MRTVRITAKTIEAAVAEGLEKLGISREEAVVHVVEQPSSGLFGLIHKKMAVVDISAPDEAAEEDTVEEASPVEEAPAAEIPAEEAKEETPVEEAPEAMVEEVSETDALRAELESAQNDLAAEKDKNLRLRAEYDNFRKRSARERDNIYADVKADTLLKFLPVYDSLSRALAQTPADDPARKGLEGIMNQYNTALNQLGVTAIEAVGQPFDANRHNAVMHIEDDAYGEGVVVEEFEKGFCIGDRVLRYSVVKVAN